MTNARSSWRTAPAVGYGSLIFHEVAETNLKLVVTKVAGGAAIWPPPWDARQGCCLEFRVHTRPLRVGSLRIILPQQGFAA